VLLKPAVLTLREAISVAVNQDILEMEKLVAVRKLKHVYNVQMRYTLSLHTFYVCVFRLQLLTIAQYPGVIAADMKRSYYNTLWLRNNNSIN